MARDEFECIVCASGAPAAPVQDIVKGDKSGTLRIVRCSNCGHVQLNPPDYSLEFYDEDGQVNFVVQNYGTPMTKIFEHSWIEARRRVARFAEKQIPLDRPANGQSLRVLDVGGGYGFFASELLRAQPTADVVVMEPSAKRAEMGRFDLENHTPTVPVPQFLVALLDEDFVRENRGTYDFVILWHVLEHVTDPVGLLALAHELLAPGGMVCVEVPNLDDELNRLSPAFRARNFMAEHVSYFSPHTLEAAARRAAPEARVEVYGYQRYGIFNYFHWAHFNKPQGEDPDMFPGTDRWWLETAWRSAKEATRTSDALFMTIRV